MNGPFDGDMDVLSIEQQQPTNPKFVVYWFEENIQMRFFNPEGLPEYEVDSCDDEVSLLDTKTNNYVLLYRINSEGNYEKVV